MDEDDNVSGIQRFKEQLIQHSKTKNDVKEKKVGNSLVAKNLLNNFGA